MTDIVKQLRDIAEMLDDDEHYLFAPLWAPPIRDAADEIERLWAEIDEYRADLYGARGGGAA